MHPPNESAALRELKKNSLACKRRWGLGRRGDSNLKDVDNGSEELKRLSNFRFEGAGMREQGVEATTSNYAP